MARVGEDFGAGNRERVFVHARAAVVGTAFEFPNFHHVAGGVRGGRGGQRLTEGEFDAAGDDVPRRGQRGRLARGAQAIKTALLLGLRRGPRREAGEVELAVGGMHAAAHDAGRKIGDRQAAERALRRVAGAVGDDDFDAALAVGKIEERAVEGAPFFAVDPHEFGGRAVDGFVHPQERRGHGGVGRVGGRAVAPHVAEKLSGRDAVDAVHRHPVTLLVGDEEGAVGVQAHAVGGAKTVGEDFGLRAVGGDFQQRAVLRDEGGAGVAGALRVVEISGGVGLQAHGELVEVIGDLMVAVHVLIEIRLAVAVEVPQRDELVAARDEDFGAAELDPERLKETGGDALPRHGVGATIDAVDAPDVAVPRAHHGLLAPGEKIHAARAHAGAPRIALRQGEALPRKRALRLAAHDGRSDDVGPMGGAAAREGREVPRRGGGAGQRIEGRGGRAGFREPHGETQRRRRRGDTERDELLVGDGRDGA